MKKSNLTRSLMAAVSIVALSAVMYGCTNSSDDPPAMTDEPDPTPTDNAMAALESAGSAAQTANTALSAANAALGTVTNAVTAAAQAFSNATGDAIATAKAAYDAAVAELMMKKEAQVTAAMALGEAIAAYETAHSVLSILDPTNAALAPATTAIAALKMAQADMTAVAAADAALAVAANTADPVTTKAAYDAAYTAHDTAKSMQATEKGKLDAAVGALDAARTALEGATGDGIAPAVEAYNTALDDLAAAQTAYDTAVADTKARLDTLDMALAAWAKADPDAVGLKDAMAMIAKLKADQDEAAKKAAAELKEVQDDLAKAKKDLQDILDAQERERQRLAALAMAKQNAGYTAALSTASSFDAATVGDNVTANRRLMSIGIDQTATPAAANLTIERQMGLKMMATGWTQGMDAAPSIGSGWNGVTLKQNRRDDDGEKIPTIHGETMAYVYSDIEQAESDSTKITELADDNAAILTALRTYIPSALSLATNFLDNGRINLNSIHATNTNWWADGNVKVAAGVLPTELNVTKVLPDRFSATVAGMPGIINCPTVGGCTARKTGGNTYVIAGVTDGADATSMAFTPTAGSDATVVVYTDDDTYLSFGWWIATPDNEAASGYRFGSFANSVDGAEPNYTLPNEVTGKASYRGPAAGIYAEKKHGEQEARSGMFTAEANLTADFLGASAGAHVSGSVSKFMSGGESLGEWTVVLGGSAVVNAAGDGTETTLPAGTVAGGTGTGVAASGTGTLDLDGGITTGTFDGLAVNGVWQGQLAGDPTRPGVPTSEHDAPNNIIGTFDASTHGTSPAGAIQVSGAFGTEKQ